MIEKKAPVKKAAKSEEGEVARAVRSLDASNQGVTDALQYVGDALTEMQKKSRRDRVFYGAVAFLSLCLLFGLGINAYQGREAREKLVDQSQTQLETLHIVQEATSAERQAQGARQLQGALTKVNCDNQRNIQRAMTQLGIPNYELTEECR